MIIISNARFFYLLLSQVSSLTKLSRFNATKIAKLKSQNSALADRVVKLSRNARSVRSQLATISTKLEDARQQKRVAKERKKELLNQMKICKKELQSKAKQIVVYDEFNQKNAYMVFKRKQQYRGRVLSKLDEEIDCKRKERFKLRCVVTSHNAYQCTLTYLPTSPTTAKA